MSHNNAWVRRRVDPIAIDFGTRFIRMVQLAQHGDQLAVVGCAQREVPVLGYLPYHDSATESMIRGQSLIEHADNPLAPIIENMWRRMEGILNE